MKLPKLPELPEEPTAAAAKKHHWKAIKVVTVADLEFVRWLKDGVLLELSNFFSGESGSFGWNIDLTITVDAKGKARLTKVKKTEVFYDN